MTSPSDAIGTTGATATETLPGFTLEDLAGAAWTFPAKRASLLCFVKEDCPTCVFSLPLIEAATAAYGHSVDVRLIGQDRPGNEVLVEQHDLRTPMLDDDALAVSFAYDVETVPTIVLADEDGRALRQFVGFGRDDWRTLFADIAALTGKPAPEMDWDAYPELRPGCGSRSVEPGIYERLVAESEGSPLRARRIEVAPSDDVVEFLFDQGLTDGLPVVPPTPERVLRMLTGTRRDAQEVVAVVPPNLAPATVEKVAINAVMAGCRPEYLPVVIAAVEAMCTDEFNIHGVSATTMGAAPLIIVNGPIRERIGLNMRLGALGAGHRANASIGRAVRLVLRNVGGARPGGTERSTQGNSMKYTACFAEWEERSPWAPLHVERGFAPTDSVVTVFATTGQSLLVDQTSRTAKQLAGSFGVRLEAVQHPKGHGAGDVFVAVCPEHVDTLSRDGMTKDELRARIQDVSARPARELLIDDEVGAGLPPGRVPDGELDRPLPKFRSTDNIHIVVAGSDAGKFSTIFDGWASGAVGSMPTSRKIEEVP